jgi:quinoprotein glucose dehydrogenase
MRALLVLTAISCLAADRDWPAYGGGPAGTRYSPLKQIDRSNIARLHVAWTYDTNDGPGDPQTQPILVNGTLYGVTPTHKTIALDGATGRLLWTFDSGVRGRGPNRSVVWWSSGAERRLFVAVQSFVYALDPATGKPTVEFGAQGRIDLRENLGRDPAKQSYVLTSPGIVYRDLLIVGGRLPESLPAGPGDIRAYDVRTGKLRFHANPLSTIGAGKQTRWASEKASAPERVVLFSASPKTPKAASRVPSSRVLSLAP